MEAMGLLGGFGILLLGVFLIIAAIMAILMPFYVKRIRDEVIQINKKLDSLPVLASALRKD